MNRIFFCLAIFCMASPALAQSVSLSCTLDTKDGPKIWDVNLNETAGTVTFTHSMGTYRARAFFTPTEVIWANGDVRIDRTSLAFTRRLTFGGKDLGTDRGKCELLKEQRAF